jgi:aryl-alcohol dehydrogenase-like predicted oxidoreductase
VLAEAKARRVGIIARSPLAQGLLTDAQGETMADRSAHFTPEQIAMRRRWAEREFLEFPKPARGIAPRDQRADRGPRHHVGFDAALAQPFEHADMRPAARRAGAERNADARSVRTRAGARRDLAWLGLKGNVDASSHVDPLLGTIAQTAEPWMNRSATRGRTVWMV